MFCFYLYELFRSFKKKEEKKNGLRDARVRPVSPSAISVRCLIWSAGVEERSPRLGLGRLAM